jgi:chromosome segregation protein
VFLKRIEIYGFKSFAGRSVLDFEYSKRGNITAVVGPNGSGKSNVADAIRWVTGEQSSKNLRSKKGEDVIFCGSSAKPRGSYAAVSLLLSSDTTVKFEINNKEYELSEIEISRKLYRSGESEYLINHKKVRLTDVHQLLASLGFGQSSYTVIGQGMVDRLLFFTASERKVLFDEAAGVKQYEIKREQAMRKLESTDSNLIRLKDILTELEPRVVNLRRLVKRAEGRKEFETQLVETQQVYFGSLLSEYSDKIHEVNQNKTELNKKCVQSDNLITELQGKIDTRSENPHTEERESIENRISSVTSERDILMREVAYLKGQAESNSRNKLQVTSKRTELTEEKQSLAHKIGFLTSKIDSEALIFDEATTTKSELEKPVLRLSEEIQAVEKSLHEPISKQTSSIDELKNRFRALTTKKIAAEESTTRIAELEKQAKCLSDEVLAAKADQQEAQKDADRSQSELDKLEKEVKTLSSLVNPDILADLEKSMTEIEKLTPNDKTFDAKLNEIFGLFRNISKAINNDERERLDDKISKIRRDYRETSDKLVNLRVLLGARESQLGRIQADIAENRTKLAGGNISEAEIAELQEEIAKQKGSASERQNALLRQKNELQASLAAARDELHRAELDCSRLNVLVSNQRNELESTNRRLSVVENSLAQLETEYTDAGISELDGKLKAKERELDRKEEDLAKLRGGLTQVIASERELEQSSLVYEREKRSLQDEKSKILSNLSVLDIEIAKTQVRLEDLNEEIRLGGLTIDPDKKCNYLDQMEKDVLRLKMENIKRKLSTTASVDPETEAEYAELETRATEMANQVADLSQAKSDLEKVVLELDERIRRQFADVFKHISSEFSRYFSMLFNGGSATLKLGEDEEGTFGIDISANPPGKRVQSLNALSGGERTLTSLALLFAILSVNPSPFCVLDEVDAALDESNTLRFIKILGDLAKKTQFIIISHNRDTMKVASSLYGVTMNDEHVSKLLSVKLTEALVAAK